MPIAKISFLFAVGNREVRRLCNHLKALQKEYSRVKTAWSYKTLSLENSTQTPKSKLGLPDHTSVSIWDQFKTLRNFGLAAKVVEIQSA